MKLYSIIDTQDGMATVIALLTLSVLTLLGMSVISTSLLEQNIARNERLYQEIFYLAESAANEGARQLEDTDNEKLNSRDFTQFAWLKKNDSTNVTTGSPTTWVTNDPDDTANNNAVVADVSLGNRGTTMFSVIEEGVAKDASLDLSAATRMYEYEVNGLCDDQASGNGYVLIEIGYKKRH